MDGIAVEGILDGEDDAGGGAGAGDFFDDDGVGDVIEAGAAFGFGDGDSGEAEFGGFMETFAREFSGLVVFAGERLYLRFREFANGFLEELLVFGQSEIHFTSPDVTFRYSRRRVYVVSRSSGRTRVSPTTVMKLESPNHRGRTWRWMWPTTPAPPARERFMPTFMPSGL